MAKKGTKSNTVVDLNATKPIDEEGEGEPVEETLQQAREAAGEAGEGTGEGGSQGGDSNGAAMTTKGTRYTIWTDERKGLAVDAVLKLAETDSLPTKNELHEYLTGLDEFAPVAHLMTPENVGLKWSGMVTYAKEHGHELPRLAHLPKSKREKIAGWLSRVPPAEVRANDPAV